MKKYKFITILIFVFSFFLILSSCDNDEKDNEELKEYVVSFDPNYENKEIITEKILENELLEEPTNIKRDGYIIDGWYLNDELFEFNKAINSDILLKAKWLKSATVNIQTGVNGEEPIKGEFTFKEEYLDNNNEFNKNLALFAYGSAITNSLSTNEEKFLNDLEFDNVESVKYTNGPGIMFSFGHKRLTNDDFIVLSIRGLAYSTEWIGNFDIGLSGNHKDFEEKAYIVYDSIKQYIENHNYNNPKLLITGYSRAGAISNVLSYLMMEDLNKVVSDNNLYCYTFEAPMPLLKENAKQYNNVFNIINSADIVTHVLPEKFDFARCGIDVDIYNIDADFSKYRIEAPFFKKFYGCSEPKDLPEYIIDLISKESEDSNYDSSTRENFVNNYSNTFSFLFSMFFSLKNDTKDNIMNGMTDKNPLEIITLFTNKEELYDYLKPILDEDGFSYDDNILRDFTDKMTHIISSSSSLVPIIISNDGRNTLISAFYNHVPAVNYVYLKEYIGA